MNAHRDRVLAGMCGVVTLAAAFVPPKSTPHRDMLALAATTRDGWLLRPGPGDDGCEHLAPAPCVKAPASPRICRERGVCRGCIWALPHLRHLRLLQLVTGRRRRAALRDTGRPVMRSFEPGETWRRC